MQTFKTLNDAIELARYAHRNQTDQSGQPYFDHPMRVMRTVQAQGALPYVQMAAVLHDVTEDTAFTHQMLLDLGFGEPVVQIVKLVDRDYSAIQYAYTKFGSGIDYRVSLQAVSKDELNKYYYAQIKKHPGALMVKLADIADNTLPWRLSYFGPEKRQRLTLKYENALEQLTGVLS